MVTGTDFDEQPQQNGAFGGSMSYPVGPAAQSQGLIGRGGSAASAIDPSAAPAYNNNYDNTGIDESYPIVDDSDTSDEESDGEYDRYPDPHPADPDMTGWSQNQVGCYFYGRYKHFKKKWRNYQGSRKPPGRRLSRPRARSGRISRRSSYAVNGRPRRGNPIGRDGNPLKCHICGSTEHLQATCPQQRQQRRSTHNALNDYEYPSAPAQLPSEPIVSLEQSMQRGIRGQGGNNLGIITYLDPQSSSSRVTI